MITIHLLALIVIAVAIDTGSLFSTKLMRIMECVNVDRSLIHFVVLTRNSTRNNHVEDYANQIIPNLERLNAPYIIKYVDLNYEYEVIDYSELFSWSGEKFEIRKSQVNKSITTDGIEAAHPFRYTRSVTSSATILVTEDIQVLNEYLVGTPRSPFYNPSSVFNIIILEKPDDAEPKIRKIVAKLWRQYGIIIAVLIFTSEDHVSLSYFSILSF